MRHWSTRLLGLWLVLLLCGCAVSPYAKEPKQRSDALLETQIREAGARLAPGQPPRVIFAGFAMHSESNAFRGDVLLAEKVMRGIDPQAVVFKLSNPAFGQEADLPFATRENVAAVLQAIGAQARPQDKVVVLLTTHGHVNLLEVYAANTRLGVVGPAELREWLAPLRGQPTLLMVSACYSGSFLPTLRGPSRIVLTAAADDRPSFGCQFHSRNTFFIEELLGQPGLAAQSLSDWVPQAYRAIEQRELALKLAPSQPQAFFGADVQAWARQPIAQWLN
ncbi:C13 family peptidase [Ramlibacter tataouinensis]|nr:C13 family peptidase [Ramlibacter tataouinensis]